MYSTAYNLWTFTWFVHFELPFRLKGTEKFIPRDSLNSPLIYILFSLTATHQAYKYQRYPIVGLVYKKCTLSFLNCKQIDLNLFFYFLKLQYTSRERSFLLGELRLSHVKERTSFLSKPRLNVTISTRFSPHLIFCLGIKFTSPHVVSGFSRYWSEQLGTTASQIDSKILTKTE